MVFHPTYRYPRHIVSVLALSFLASSGPRLEIWKMWALVESVASIDTWFIPSSTRPPGQAPRDARAPRRRPESVYCLTAYVNITLVGKLSCSQPCRLTVYIDLTLVGAHRAGDAHRTAAARDSGMLARSLHTAMGRPLAAVVSWTNAFVTRLWGLVSGLYRVCTIDTGFAPARRNRVVSTGRRCTWHRA